MVHYAACSRARPVIAKVRDQAGIDLGIERQRTRKSSVKLDSCIDSEQLILLSSVMAELEAEAQCRDFAPEIQLKRALIERLIMSLAPNDFSSRHPLVSCILLTRDRPGFALKAIDYFMRQDYPQRELLIVDDGSESIQSFLPADRRLRYIRLPQLASSGEKRNRGCEAARGSVIAHWEDSDWQAPRRLRHQVEAMLRTNAELSGIYRQLYYCPGTDGPIVEQAWVNARQHDGRSWPSTSSLCYTRDFWSRNRFAATDMGAEATFIKFSDVRKVALMPDSTLQVSIIHPEFVDMRGIGGTGWRHHPVDRIHALLGSDLQTYQTFHDVGSIEWGPPTPPNIAGIPRTFPLFTLAHTKDLSLPEFVAYNRGERLSRVQRWSHPFALFQAEIGSNMSVLNCSVEDGGFRSRLLRLFPHTLYNHVSPIHLGSTAGPAGVPDEAFDRVLCTQALGPLSDGQKETLVSTLAAKLKPGGMFVLTQDFPIPAAPSTAVGSDLACAELALATEGQKYTTRVKEELNALCARHGLIPKETTPKEATPKETTGNEAITHEPAPILTIPGSAQAVVGAVFYKGHQKRHRKTSQGKAVVLALLTWNKRDVSIDSVKAYVQEARMLRRLGLRPLICVCDNGSTDGTQEAIRALEPLIDVPYRFIFNGENKGNCIARNQIIDTMLETGADYLLFMDGDIEVVPFSSFAMLRYLEDSGDRLGCIGADSTHQTPHRNQASRFQYAVHACPVDTDNAVAWTQYGMFRRAVFEAGIRFDETGPFAGPGWGFEDNDLAFQMEEAGFLLQRFSGMTYLHRDLRSSVRLLEARGIDATSLCELRRLHVINRWADVPAINNGPLRRIRGMHFAHL